MEIFRKEKIDRFTRNYYLLGIKIFTRKKKKIKFKDNSYLSKSRKRDALITLKCLRNLSTKINTVETMVLGHSHARFGFKEDNNSINFGIDAEDLYYSYMILDKYKNIIPNLKNIVLVFSIFSPGNDLQLSKEHAYRTAYYDVFMDIPYKNKYLAFKDNIIKFAEKLYKLKPYIEKNLDKIPYNIMAENTPIYNSKELEQKYINSWIKLNKKNTEMHYIKHILDICKDKNYKLTIVLSPYNPRIKNLIPKSNECYKSLFEIIKDNPYVQILDCYNDDDFKEENFIDIEHLNISGSELFTAKINNKLYH